VYALAAMTPLVPGTGVALQAQADPGIVSVGQQATILATLTQDGVPVTGAAVTALITQPDGGTLEQALDATGDGVYAAVLTGTAAAGGYAVKEAAGVNTPDQLLEPFEQLVVQVEADLFLAAHVNAGARLRADDSSLIAIATASADLRARRSMLSFGFSANRIFQHGLPGPYTLGELTLTGATETGTAASLTEGGVVAVTQPYALEDFAPSPSFTVGGTVSGLVGFGLVLEIQSGSSVPGP